MSSTFKIGAHSLLASDREAIRDAFERLDAAADRGESCGDQEWITVDYQTVTVDPGGDLWIAQEGGSPEFVAERDGDFLVPAGAPKIRI